jgi:hypothetical protein
MIGERTIVAGAGGQFERVNMPSLFNVVYIKAYHHA